MLSNELSEALDDSGVPGMKDIIKYARGWDFGPGGKGKKAKLARPSWGNKKSVVLSTSKSLGTYGDDEHVFEAIRAAAHALLTKLQLSHRFSITIDTEDEGAVWFVPK